MIKVFEQIKSEKKQIENISKIITSASKIFDKYSDVKTAIKGALQSYKTHANQLQNIVTKSWGSQGQKNKLKNLRMSMVLCRVNKYLKFQQNNQIYLK